MSDMTDRELLELAAKAAECSVLFVGNGEGKGIGSFYMEPDLLWWNPLEDDGDALRLAVELGLDISFVVADDNLTVIGATTGGHQFECINSGDKLSATRRAIVLAAAHIGLHMGGE